MYTHGCWKALVSSLESERMVARMEPGKDKDDQSEFITKQKDYIQGQIVRILTEEGAISDLCVYQKAPWYQHTACSVVIKDDEATFVIDDPPATRWSNVVRVERRT